MPNGTLRLSAKHALSIKYDYKTKLESVSLSCKSRPPL